MLVVKRSLAVVMTILVITSLFFTVKAIGQGMTDDRRVDRIERRQDHVLDSLAEIKGRLAVVEQSAYQSANHLDRLIYGVIGLTIAVIGQLLFSLIKFKLDRDDRSQAIRNRIQDRSDRGYSEGVAP